MYYHLYFNYLQYFYFIHDNIIIIYVVYVGTRAHITVRLFLFAFCVPGAVTAPQQLPSLALTPRADLVPSELPVPKPWSLRTGWDPCGTRSLQWDWKHSATQKSECCFIWQQSQFVHLFI